MKEDISGPAFPVQDASKWQAHGMSLRDYFAAKALPAILGQEDGGIQSYNPNSQCGDGKVAAERWAEQAYQIADAMLRERAK